MVVDVHCCFCYYYPELNVLLAIITISVVMCLVCSKFSATSADL